MRKFIFNLHLYFAFIAGAFILVFGITGSIMAFEPEIDHMFHQKLFYLKAGSKVLSLADISDIVKKDFPTDTITDFAPSTSPRLSYQIYLKDKIVYMNQYTGAILGTSSFDDGISRFLNKVHQLHIRLIYHDKNDSGKIIMSWSGVILLLLIPTGLFLWWKQKRTTVRWKSTSRTKWFDIHSVIGFVSFLFFFILAGTGVLIAFEKQTVPLFYKMTNSEPVKEPEIKITPAAGVYPISPDSAMQIAKLTLPGALPFEINIPDSVGFFAIRCRYPEDRTPGGRTRIYIDQYSGKVLFSLSSRNGPAGYRMQVTTRAIHTGDIFGIPSKIIMSLASLMLVIQLFSGFNMWWSRRKKMNKILKE